MRGLVEKEAINVNRKNYTPVQIITKLREAEVLQSQGMSAEEVARTLEIAPQIYYPMAIRIWAFNRKLGYKRGMDRIFTFLIFFLLYRSFTEKLIQI